MGGLEVGENSVLEFVCVGVLESVEIGASEEVRVRDIAEVGASDRSRLPHAMVLAYYGQQWTTRIEPSAHFTSED